MNARSMFYTENKNYSNAEEKAFARDRLIFNVTEDLLIILEDMEITKSELARRLGKSKSYVTQVLSGARNMTLGSFSDICYALNIKPKIDLPVNKTRINDWEHEQKPIKNKIKRTATTNIIHLENSLHWKRKAA